MKALHSMTLFIFKANRSAAQDEEAADPISTLINSNVDVVE